MRLREIFSRYDETIGDGIEAITKRANDAVKSANVQKKQADITKAKDNVAKKRGGLADITKGQ
jgi:hypothetical protein